MKRINVKRSISISLMAILLSIVMSGIFVFQNEKGTQKVQAATIPSHETTEILYDVDKYFAFEITSDKKINEKNFDKFVKVEDAQGKKHDINVAVKDGYCIVYPETAYTEGRIYTISLTNAEFLNEKYAKTLAFQVLSPVKENVELTENIVSIEKKEGEGIEIDEENKRIYFESGSEQYRNGDLLLIPTKIPDSEFYVDAVYRVETVNGNVIAFSIPELDDVYSEFEISNTYQAQDYTLYNDIEEQLISSTQIDAISKALYDFKNYQIDQSGNVVKNNISLMPSSVNIDINTINPLDLNAEIKWDIASDLSVKLNLGYSALTVATYSGSATEKSQTTTQTGRWEISIALEYSKSVNIQKIFDNVTKRNKYAKNLHDVYVADKALAEAEKKLKNETLSENERREWQTKKEDALRQVGYSDLNRRYLESQDKRAAMLALDSLTNYYKNQASASKSVMKFVQLYIPVVPTVAFVVDCGAVLDFSLSAAFEAKLVIDSINEISTVTAENSQGDYTNSYYEVSGYAGIIGTFTIKIGAQLGIGVTVAGIFNMDLTFEGGVYFKFNAMGILCFGKMDSLGLSEEETEIISACREISDGKCKLYGSVSYDIGMYGAIEYTVGFDLWITEITKHFPLVKKEESFLKNETVEESLKDLVFEDKIGVDSIDEIKSELEEKLNKGTVYDSTRIFEIENTEENVSVQLPNVYIRNIDWHTGLISYDQVSVEDLIFINQEDVFNDGLTIYVRDMFKPELDNRLNIRVNSTDEQIAELFLQIRVVKKPIEVDSVTLSGTNGINTIGLTESKYLSVEILPYNATYQNFDYQIEKILKPDGSVYTDDLLQYAYIKNNELFTTEKIAIGAKIHVSAQTQKDLVKSNVLVFEVERIGIERIDFCDEYQRGDINLGETMSLQMTIYPQNATINILQDSEITVALQDGELALLSKVDDLHYTLTASDKAGDRNKDILLRVSAENYIKTYTYRIGTIPIESMEIHDKRTSEVLPVEFEMYRNDSMDLDVKIKPLNASVGGVAFHLVSDTVNYGRYISVDDTGLLQIKNDAPFGMVVYLSATAMHTSTEAYKITIVRVPVDAVLITANTSYIVQNTVIHFKATIEPEYADAATITYRIVNNVSGVLISGNMVYATATAEIGTEIQIEAIVDGVVSNVFSLYIIADPNTPITPAEGESSGEQFIHESRSEQEGGVHGTEG